MLFPIVLGEALSQRIADADTRAESKAYAVKAKAEGMQAKEEAAAREAARRRSLSRSAA